MKPEYIDRILFLLEGQDEIFKDVVKDYVQQFEDKTKYFDKYNFKVFIYNRLYEAKNIQMEDIDRRLAFDLWNDLRDEHIINWTRKKLYNVNADKMKEYQDKLKTYSSTTTSFEFFKVCMYLDRMGLCIVDDYMLRVIPELNNLICVEQ